MPNVSASWNASLPMSLRGDLAGDGDDRDRIHHRVHQAGDQVGGAGTGGGAADADFAGGARVAFGGEGGILLVPDQHVADVVVVQGVIEGQGDAAGIAEDAIHAFPGQTFQQHFRAAHQGSTYGKTAPWIYQAYITKKATDRVFPPPRWPAILFSGSLRQGPLR